MTTDALGRSWKHRWVCFDPMTAAASAAATVEDALAAAIRGLRVYDTREARWISHSGDYINDAPLPDVKDQT
jgi:hypothetical protein